jgi:hypothetical protein
VLVNAGVAWYFLRVLKSVGAIDWSLSWRQLTSLAALITILRLWNGAIDATQTRGNSKKA